MPSTSPLATRSSGSRHLQSDKIGFTDIGVSEIQNDVFLATDSFARDLPHRCADKGPPHTCVIPGLGFPHPHTCRGYSPGEKRPLFDNCSCEKRLHHFSMEPRFRTIWIRLGRFPRPNVDLNHLSAIQLAPPSDTTNMTSSEDNHVSRKRGDHQTHTHVTQAFLHRRIFIF